MTFETLGSMKLCTHAQFYTIAIFVLYRLDTNDQC